jgi:RNAse (barnase) inhibitor barstar
MKLANPMKPLLNLDDLDQAGIHPLKEPEALACLIQASEASSLHYFVIDIADTFNKAQLLDRFAETLKFPDYFGHNWDALYDVLCDQEWFGNSGVVFHLKHTDSFERLAADDWLALCATLEEAIGYWRWLSLPFWVFVDYTHCQFD